MGRRISMLVILLIVLIGALALAKEKGSRRLMQKTRFGPDFLTEKEWEAPQSLKLTPIIAPTDVQTTYPLVAEIESHLIQDQVDTVSHFDQITTGDDGQAKTYNITPGVEPPYDEALVDFYHGRQRITNFGALGNGEASENFVWYGTNYLFDGTFMIASSDADHMALDLYGCEHWGWIPSEYLLIYYDSEYDANVAFADFYSDSIPGAYDSLFVVGLMEECADFSIKIDIYYNPTDDPIPELYTGIFEDWDVNYCMNNWVEMDTLRNLIFTYDPDSPTLVFGTMNAPFSDALMHSMIAFDLMYEIWIVIHDDWCTTTTGLSGRDTLFALITNPYPHYRFAGWFDPNPSDYALLMSIPPFSLNPGEEHIEIWIDFGRDLSDGLSWAQWRHRVLRYVGFYRGDVTESDPDSPSPPDLGDLIYIVNYLYKSGSAPFPYADQGDVNADRLTDLEDVVYIINYIFKGGPPPTDYVRFIPSMWSRPSLFTNPYWD